VGSIDEFVDVLSNAQLLEEQLIQGEGDTPSLATRGGIEVCTDGDACQKKFGEKFPKFGMLLKSVLMGMRVKRSLVKNF